jgi:arylformamidase
MPIYDITRQISPDMAVWPGDTPVNVQVTGRIAEGSSVNVSAVTMSCHTGTHVDAPYHYFDDGARMNQVDLDVYVGRATVVDMRHVSGPARPEHLAGVDLDRIERILFKTQDSQRPDTVWDPDFVYLSAELATLFGEKGIRLYGTDAPSVDKSDSKTLPAHHALGHGNVLILEGLMLDGIEPGDYELIALPLKLERDGSPVRAILRTLD